MEGQCRPFSQLNPPSSSIGNGKNGSDCKDLVTGADGAGLRGSRHLTNHASKE